MPDKIGSSTPHNVLVTNASDEAIHAETTKALDGITHQKGGDPNVLGQTKWQRFKVSVLLRLSGKYGAYVKTQNTNVKNAFVTALKSGKVNAGNIGLAQRVLDKQIKQANADKHILTFQDLDQVLSLVDQSAKKELLSYLPSSNGTKSLIDAPQDGTKFLKLATKYGLDTPELKEKFRTSLETRLFALAHDEGAGAAADSLEDFAVAAAARVSKGGVHAPLSGPLTAIYDEFPGGLSESKFIQDGKFEAQGKPEHGAQTFIFFKRVSDEGIPYDAQKFADLQAAKNGAPEKANTPAAKGALSDVPQKFHLSVPPDLLLNNTAWAPVHDLLTSDESPFNQWKISNIPSLKKADQASLDELEKDFTQGYNKTLRNGQTKFIESIPDQRAQLGIEKNLQSLRVNEVKAGRLSQKEFDVHELRIKNRESEINAQVAKYEDTKQSLLTALSDTSGRLVANAQYTLYTQHAKGEPWKPEEVKKYTDFLLKIETALKQAGVPPVGLPPSDAPVPGLQYASFRDEDIGENAETAAADAGVEFDYTKPPDSLIQEYKNSPFYQLAADQIAATQGGGLRA
jgi:hypothetical protein